MIRALLPPAVPRRRVARPGPALASAATALAGPSTSFAQTGSTAAPWAPAALAMALLLTLLAVAGAVALGVWLQRSRRSLQIQATELQRLRAEAHGLRGLLDVWQWRTDAAHRLVAWHAPHGERLPAAGAALVWTRFLPDDGDLDALRTRFEQQLPLEGLQAQIASRPGEAPRSLWLHGTPVLDADGQFAGYVGTARARQAAPASLVAEAVFGMPVPALRLLLSAPGGVPLHVARNAATDPWFDALPVGSGSASGVAPPDDRAAPVATPTWPDLLRQLPAALRPAVEQVLSQVAARPDDVPAGASVADVDGTWRVQAQRLPSPATDPASVDLLLSFHRVGAAPAVAPAAVSAADESESFSYTVSHDLRAPIRVVEGFAKIVKEDYGHNLDRIGNDHLDRVLAAAARMNSMIDSLLALSQLSSRPLSRQPVNLSLLAGYIVDDLRRQSPEREVEVIIEPGLQVNGDATLLRIVLENLLGNAWKYTGKCRVGRIWFEASEHEGRPAITVRDNGAGFDMRFADRLFGVFQRLHSANDFQGTGVGLASVRRIIRRHGGDIWATAEVDRGARFQFWI